MAMPTETWSLTKNERYPVCGRDLRSMKENMVKHGLHVNIVISGIVLKARGELQIYINIYKNACPRDREEQNNNHHLWLNLMI
jgi:hypothetical protein